MKILVTGASGQLGSELKRALHEVSQEISGIETFFLDRKNLPLDQLILIQDILGMYQPDIIVHTAAYTAVDRAESDRQAADTVNHLATAEIAQYCHIHGTKLIAISTDYVFDGESDQPLKEDAPTAPISVYGETKLWGEQAVQKWAPDSIIIRTSWVYSSYGSNFVKTMLRLMNERTELSVVADQIGTPTYAHDLAQAIVQIIQSPQWQPGIYHYSNEGEISWYDFAVAIRDIAGLSCAVHPIPTTAYPTPAKRPRYSLLDKSKIKATFGVIVPNWRESLKHMLHASERGE
ncbi:dTDP-4-dehydrorhamnose reductase [Sphingobacterium suaedae]|uniref:dTDP-4-dehydrorhamnose reductase n=1 Tax=Sphingobacterium suaedae TaxID=1686402 RepID=A0ABW5KM55_9SPHI